MAVVVGRVVEAVVSRPELLGIEERGEMRQKLQKGKKSPNLNQALPVEKRSILDCPGVSFLLVLLRLCWSLSDEHWPCPCCPVPFPLPGIP